MIHTHRVQRGPAILLDNSSREGNREPPPTIIFLHLAKTGGTTLLGIIGRQFPKGSRFNTATIHLHDPARSHVNELKALSDQEKGKIRWVHLHPLPFGVHEHLPAPCIYVTFLRDPVDRVLSHYYFLLSSPNRRARLQGERTNDGYLSLEEFAQGRPNLQTRMLAGVGGPAFSHMTYTDPLPSDILETAKANVASHFAPVGIQERFDESLVLLATFFGWTDVRYVKRNTTRYATRKEDIGTRTLQAIADCNELDIALHEWASNELQRTVSEQGAWLQAEVERFRKRNSSFQRRQRIYSSLPFPARYLIARGRRTAAALRRRSRT